MLREEKSSLFLYNFFFIKHNTIDIKIIFNGDVMLRFTLFLIGFGLSIVGFIYIIMYLNYLSIGFSFIEYLKYIITKIECLLAPVGIVLISISIFIRGDKHVLCI